MTVGDCIILIGSSKDEPMTIYRILGVRGDKIDALSILIKKGQIMGWDFPSEYDNDIPDGVILLPCDTYAKVKQQMKDFYIQSCKYIQANLINAEFEIEIGKHYCDRFIYTVTKIEDGRVHYNVFRIEPENISPCWIGEERMDGIKESWRPISNELYEELLSRYKKFVSQLQEYLYALAKKCSNTGCK